MKFQGSLQPEKESILYLHFTELFQIGTSRPLSQQDLETLPEDAQVKTVFSKFSEFWKEENSLDVEKRGIWSPISKLIGIWRLCGAFLLILCFCITSFAQPLILEQLTKYQQGQINLSSIKKWILICMVFFIPLFSTVCKCHSSSYLNFFSVQIRNALNAAIYNKTLRLSPNSRNKYTSAEISNLFTQDTLFIENMFLSLSNVLLFPLQIIIALVLIYYQVGISMLVGFAYIIFLLPLLAMLAVSMEFFMDQYLKEKDNRLSAIYDLLSGIRIIKTYAWEDTFYEIINKLRITEMSTLIKVANLWNISQVLFMSVSVVLPIVVFYCYIRLGHTLDLSTAFTTLMLFAIIREPIMYIPYVAQSLVQALSASKRINAFLLCEEFMEYVEHHLTHTSVEEGITISLDNKESNMPDSKLDIDSNNIVNDVAIILDKCSFGWKLAITDDETNEIEVKRDKEKVENSDTRSADNTYTLVVAEDNKNNNPSDDSLERSISTLQNINLSVKKGELVAVCGGVGSGKKYQSYLYVLYKIDCVS
jgi:ABC-type multidrug transport system fused ATPase/permease subunit